MEQKHDIVLYQIDDTNVCVSVYFEDETFWLTTKAMAELFGVKSQAITKHLGNIYEEEELAREATCSKKEQVQIEGGREVLEGKGRISHEQAIEKAAKEYDIFRVRQDQEYVSEFDKQTEKYFKGE